MQLLPRNRDPLWSWSYGSWI